MALAPLKKLEGPRLISSTEVRRGLRPLGPPPDPIPRVPGKERMQALGARCHECPLHRHKIVPTEKGYAQPASLALVGEAPGRREVQVARPFVGKSGELLEYVLGQAGVRRRELTILNAIACGPVPSENDIVKNAAMRACRPRLINELHELRPKGLLAVGGKALAALAPPKSSGVTALRGALLPVAEDVKLPDWDPVFFSTFHPAHIMRGGDGDAPDGESDASVDLLYFFLLFDLAKAHRYATGQIKAWEDKGDCFIVKDGRLTRVVANEQLDGPPSYKPATEDEILAHLGTIVAEGRKDALTCDVETNGRDSLEANLTAIAYGTPDLGLSATWEIWKRPRLFAAIRAVHLDKTIRWNWQNGIYDRCVLPRHGLPTVGPHEDTLLQHHGCFPGLPHGLQQIAAQFFVAPPWKDEFRTNQKDEGRLVIYNARDAVATARIRVALFKFLKDTRTERVYECDRQINVIATRMRRIGLYVDRAEQARHRQVQTTRLRYMQAELAKDFASIEETWRMELAKYHANKQRKNDPDSYEERVRIRHEEIGKRKKRETDVGLFKPKAKADIIALFMVLKIPFTAYTPKGQPVTDKKAMEVAAARHPLMRRLEHIRSAMHLLATYVELPVKRDGRMHPDWKALDVTTPILTTRGWKTMGTVAVGDEVYAADGTRTAITYVSPIGARESFRVRFNDHVEVIADAEHLWPVFKQGSRGDLRIVATKNLSRRHRIPRAQALLTPPADLPIDSYVLGAWLGDGAKNNGIIYYAKFDLGVVEEFDRRGYVASSTASDLRNNCKRSYFPRLYTELKCAGFMGLREIPEVYLTASKEQRADLLRGLLDTDGSASVRGQVSFSTVHAQLARQVLFLARSLGYQAGMCESQVRVRGVQHGSQFQVFWEGWGPTFGLARKQARIKREQPQRQHRWVVAIEPAGVRDVRCIAVDHPSHCYVVGRELIVTHNTNKITGRWGAGKSQNVPNNVPGWPPETDADGNFKTNANGSLIVPRDNLRSIIAAPTADQIIAIVKAEGLSVVDPIILSRARQGHGRILVGADMDQVELRILAFLSKDPFLLKIFNEGRDPHAEFAAITFPKVFPQLAEQIKAAGFKPKQITKVEDLIVEAKAEARAARASTPSREAEEKLHGLEEVLKAMKQWKRLRDFVKRIEYGGAYRGKAQTIWEALVKEMPEVEVGQVEYAIKKFYEGAAGVPIWHNLQDTLSRTRRESREAILGRVRLFPLGNFSPTVSVNFPIQAYGASLMSLAILRFTALVHPELLEFDRLYKWKLLDARWVNEMRQRGFTEWKAPVELISNGHDALLAECDEEDGPRAAELLQSAMTLTMTDPDGTSIVYSAEAHTERRWSRA